jgi:plastocyanin
MTGTSLRRAVAACSLVAALAACSSGSGGASGTTPAAGTSAATSSASAAGASTSAGVITIKSFQFATPASVSPGATITVRNEDSTTHSVTADDGHSFDDQAPPGTTTFTAPMAPGTYHFHCTPHPFMHGTLVVR